MKSSETESRHETEIDTIEPSLSVPEAKSEVTGEDEKQASTKRRLFSRPTRAQLLVWLPFWCVIVLGAVLRFWGLGDKPLHHDESLHAYFALRLMQNDLQNWLACFSAGSVGCYQYDPLLHGPFQFHAIALVYQISQWLGLPEHGVNTYTVRIVAATLGTVIVGLPYFLRDRLGTVGAWLACLLLAISPSMVYFSRFAREDIYMACFTLLLVVAVARVLRGGALRWLVIASLAFALSYATKEATFLTIAIFGSFLGALIAWELGIKVRLPAKKYLPRNAAPLTTLLYFVLAAPLALLFFSWMKGLSLYITDKRNTALANAFVQVLKERTVAAIPWLVIAFGTLILLILIREMRGQSSWPERLSLGRFFSAERQPLLYRIFSLSWLHWLFALLSGWAVFIVLFSALFTNIHNGIGDGIWQGLYYWLQQQQVARGGQPWYYYLLLLPLYEQIGLVFGLVGMVRAVLQPTRFRLFLLYWFVGNLFIYSWAAEKMPWLLIHLTMPLLLLGAVGLEPAVSRVLALLRARFFAEKPMPKEAEVEQVGEEKEEHVEPIATAVLPERKKRSTLAGAWAIATVVLAGLLLLPTLQNMREVTYIHPADAPYEMLIYVQTTPDINIVMNKIAVLDQKLYAGKHDLPIGVTDDALWPYAWYLRDYHNVCFDYPNGCAQTANTIPIIITGGDKLSVIQQYITQGSYLFHQYRLRTWWDEGYKPPPCVPGKIQSCEDEARWGGVGPWLWLSYGDTPPPNARFDAGLALQRIWRWWWERKPFGGTDGSYNMGLFIRSDLNVAP